MAFVVKEIKGISIAWSKSENTSTRSGRSPTRERTRTRRYVSGTARAGICKVDISRLCRVNAAQIYGKSVVDKNEYIVVASEFEVFIALKGKDAMVIEGEAKVARSTAIVFVVVSESLAWKKSV